MMAKEYGVLRRIEEFEGVSHKYSVLTGSGRDYFHINDTVSNDNSVLVPLDELMEALNVEDVVEPTINGFPESLIDPDLVKSLNELSVIKS